MYMKHINTTNNTFELRKIDPHFERDTLIIENQAHMEIDQLNKHIIDSFIHGNMSHQ
jgi:hypothetical protein